MSNEENVKHLITNWLNTFNVEVYWEKKNQWNYPVFKCDGSSKPDLLIKRKCGGGNLNCFAIEVKDASSDMNLLNAQAQILKYAKQPIKFFINEQEMYIHGFLVASQFSIKGMLYENDIIKPIGKRAFGISRKQVPDNEYWRTLDYIRGMWRFAKVHGIDKPTGALLSNSLNNINSIAPLMFFKTQKWSSYVVWDKT